MCVCVRNINICNNFTLIAEKSGIPRSSWISVGVGFVGFPALFGRGYPYRLPGWIVNSGI